MIQNWKIHEFNEIQQTKTDDYVYTLDHSVKILIHHITIFYMENYNIFLI